MTMLYSTTLSLMTCSAEAIALLAPVWRGALERTLTSALCGVTRGGRHVFGGLFTRVCVAVFLLGRDGVSVLEFAHLHASLVVCFCALGTICVDALLGEIVCAATCDDEDTPAVAVRKVMLEGLATDFENCRRSVPDRSDLWGKLVFRTMRCDVQWAYSVHNYMIDV